MDVLNLIDKLREDALFKINDITASATTKEQEIYMRGIAEGLRQAAEHIADLMVHEEAHTADPYFLEQAYSRCENSKEIIEEYRAGYIKYKNT